MSDVALTNISVGRTVNDQFERVEVKVGESLPAWVTKEDIKALKDQGAIGTPAPTAATIDAKDAEIAELKRLLEEAQAAPPAPPADKVNGK